MVIHLSSTILHQIREIEYTVERDVIETPNHLFRPCIMSLKDGMIHPFAARSSREEEIWQSTR